MSLPSPGPGVYWKEYEISTPTFRINSVEKPDMSDFLIHLTGKNQLANILKGENAGDDIQIPNRHGFIKASIPQSDSSRFYNSKVVCFTDSPLFALDFFRYRSFRRWSADQRYGIGFKKEFLVLDNGVRPVIYTDSLTNNQLLELCTKFETGEIKITDDLYNFSAVTLLKKLKPLFFPLLERDAKQGYMWEKEWRSTNENGFIFPYSAIKIICCPKNEIAEITETLGEDLGNVKIVETWKEYDEVTEYLQRREKDTGLPSHPIGAITDITVLKSLKEKNDQTRNTLTGYYESFKETVGVLENKNVAQILEKLEGTSNDIQKRIDELSKS